MIYVLGLGNVLMGDDGFGPAVVRAFESEYDAGSGVEVVDLGTPGLDLSPWLFDADRIIFVDTVNIDAAPGTIRLYDKAGVLRHAPGQRVGPHDPGVKEALHTAELAGRGPAEVLLVGAAPERTTMDLELSPRLQAAVRPAVEAIADALRRWGVQVERRRAPRPLPAWWTAPHP